MPYNHAQIRPKLPRGHRGKIKAFIDKYEPQKLADIANTTRTELRQDEKERCVVEIYEIKVPFVKFNVAFNGEKFAWLVCGKNLQVETGQEQALQILKNYETAQEAERQRVETERQRAQNKGKIKQNGRKERKFCL